MVVSLTSAYEGTRARVISAFPIFGFPIPGFSDTHGQPP